VSVKIYRDALGRFRKATRREKAAKLAKRAVVKPAKRAVVKPAKRAVVKPAKHAVIKLPKRLEITINGVKLDRSHKIKAWIPFERIVEYTRVPYVLAIVRVNGKRVFTGKRIYLKDGDEIRVTRLKKTKKPTPPNRDRPLEEGGTRDKLETEFVDTDVPQPPQWVNAFPDEWLHSDGSVAVEPSFVRCDPKSEIYRAQMESFAEIWGPKSREFKELTKHIAHITNRPVREVYTLFFSP